MEIAAIKSQLSIGQVLGHYGIAVNKNKHCLCPFHDDTTPSMRVYEETNTVYCFSGNCEHGGKVIDQIDFIMYKEGCTKHQAILIAKSLLGVASSVLSTTPRAKQQANSQALAEISMVLTQIFMPAVNALSVNTTGQGYLQARGLAASPRIGYNTGRLHYKLSPEQKQVAQKLGYLTPWGKHYQVWAKDYLLFPLKDKNNQIVSLYARDATATPKNKTGDKNGKATVLKNKHYYLKGRQGLFPGYPRLGDASGGQVSAAARRLILTESIIDAESLLQQPGVVSEYSVLALYGTQGLTAEHKEAIQALKLLEDVILWLDGDAAGRAAVGKYSKVLHELVPQATISSVPTPEGEDINSLLQGHPTKDQYGNAEILLHQLAQKNILFSSSSIEPKGGNASSIEKEKTTSKKQVTNRTGILTTENPKKLLFTLGSLSLTLWGGIRLHPLSQLKVSLHLKDPHSGLSYRDELNLYHHNAVQKAIRQIASLLDYPTTEIERLFNQLTDALETYREAQLYQKQTNDGYSMSAAEKSEAMAFLRSPKLMERTLAKIKATGLVGQDKNGLLLFLLYLTRLQDDPLHAIIYGTSGSGKTYLQTKIAECLPEESVRLLTSLTENTLYYSPKDYWKHKVLLIEDLEAVYQAFLPIRELMSKQEISKMTTDKDAQGNNTQKFLVVKGPVCVSGATTKSHIYEDNANRSFLLEIEETANHQALIMEYQRREKAGIIDKEAQNKSRRCLQNSQRLLQPVTVINPYAMALSIPDQIFKKLRTNMHYLKLIESITFYHQAQRSVSTDKRLRRQLKEDRKVIKTTLEDIRWANWLVRDSLLKKSDELTTEQRNFLEQLKALVPEGQSFYAKHIRETLRMHPMKLNRYLRQLEARGYIVHKGGNRKSGYEYQIVSYLEYETLQKGIGVMDEILERLEAKYTKRGDASPVILTSK